MEIYKTHIGVVVPNATSTLIKIHELIDGTYVKETSNGYLEIIDYGKAQEYLNNFSNLDEIK